VRVDLMTRKPIQLLSATDFAAFAVWEYADDEEWLKGQDETWVRPVNSSAVPNRGYTHVAADFTTAAGRQLFGYVTVSTLERIPEVSQGVVFHHGTALFVCNPKGLGFQESRGELLAGLGLTEREMFPLSFRLRALLQGETEYLAGALP